MLLFAMSSVLLVLAVHPFTSYPVSLWILRRWRRRMPTQAARVGQVDEPSFSVCMCAYNEAAVIEAKARNLLDLRRCAQDVQILVYVDGATDDTAERLSRFGNEITVVSAQQRHGKSHGMRRLAALATGDILVFTDANVMLAPEALAGLARHFVDREVGCVCGYLQYGNPDASDTAAVNAAYWRLEERIKALEAELGSVVGADGSLFAVRRTLYPAVPDDIIDDFYVSLCILCDGHRVVRAGDVRAYECAAVDRGDEFRRKVRIACQAFNVHRLLWPRIWRLPVLHVYCYVSHKLLRWFAAPNLVGTMLLFLAAVAFSVGPVAMAAVLAFVLLTGAAAWAAGWRPARKACEIWLALLATALGMVQSLRGERFQTWVPAQSVRIAPSAALFTAHAGADGAVTGDGVGMRPFPGDGGGV